MIFFSSFFLFPFSLYLLQRYHNSLATALQKVGGETPEINGYGRVGTEGGRRGVKK